MSDEHVCDCIPVSISDDDIYDAMKEIPGYLDITPGDFKEVYLKAYEHALQRLRRSTKARDVMKKNVIAVAADTPLIEAAEILAERRISGMPVINEANEPIGVISEKDILALMAPGGLKTFMQVLTECIKAGACLARPIRSHKTADIMSKPAVTVSEDTPLADVADVLAGKRINRIPVVDESGKMVGIICRADVVRSSGI